VQAAQVCSFGDWILQRANFRVLRWSCTLGPLSTHNGNQCVSVPAAWVSCEFTCETSLCQARGASPEGESKLLDHHGDSPPVRHQFGASRNPLPAFEDQFGLPNDILRFDQKEASLGQGTFEISGFQDNR